ncbi:MAG: thermonuclease family protein [Thiohalobacteraceae bacterium]
MRFCAWLLASVVCGTPALGATKRPCGADRIDERVRISFVQDGDTLTLNDGRRLRLIGIDTPELGERGDPAEPGAIAARDRLRQLVFMHRQQLSLRFDRERKDRYGRLLAHAFVGDGRNLVELLLATGAGAQIVVPPNTWQVDCYAETSRSARREGRGIWALPTYQPKTVRQLDLRSTGFHVVRGRVSHLGNSASAIWINLVDDFGLRIEREDLDQFNDLDLEGLVGSEVEAQGWVYTRKGQLRMSLRHPSALTLIAPPHPKAPAAPVE